MAGSSRSPARATALALAAVALSACATTPAPIVAGGARRAGPAIELGPPPSFADGPPQVADYAADLQCVPFARTASGIQIFGDANTWWARAAGRYPRSATPASGAVLVLHGYRDPGRGHVAVVRRLESERIIVVDHANWLNGGEISVNVPVLDVSPGNDWSEVRVWHIPGAHWGGRVYRTQGFIHPFTLHAALS